jgi:hypothetical protein
MNIIGPAVEEDDRESVGRPYLGISNFQHAGINLF